ncbi:hypothetical protein HOG21_00660 [bacterium]|nr:hypothetical protein [bacterium]
MSEITSKFLIDLFSSQFEIFKSQTFILCFNHLSLTTISQSFKLKFQLSFTIQFFLFSKLHSRLNA